MNQHVCNLPIYEWRDIHLDILFVEYLENSGTRRGDCRDGRNAEMAIFGCWKSKKEYFSGEYRNWFIFPLTRMESCMDPRSLPMSVGKFLILIQFHSTPTPNLNPCLSFFMIVIMPIFPYYCFIINLFRNFLCIDWYYPISTNFSYYYYSLLLHLVCLYGRSWFRGIDGTSGIDWTNSSNSTSWV